MFILMDKMLFTVLLPIFFFYSWTYVTIEYFFFQKAAEVPIGSLAVSGKTKWEILDNIVRKIFKVRFACIMTISEKRHNSLYNTVFMIHRNGPRYYYKGTILQRN